MICDVTVGVFSYLDVNSLSGFNFNLLVILILRSNSITAQSPVICLFLDMGKLQCWTLLITLNSMCIQLHLDTKVLRDKCNRSDPHKERGCFQGGT